MKNLRFLLQNRGISYIQILLASSIIAGLAVVGIKMMKNQEKMARLTSQRFEINYIIKEMSYILTDPNNCRASFFELDPRGSNRKINSLKKELRGGKHKEATFYLKYFTFAASKKLYGQNDLMIMSYRLSDSMKDVDVAKSTTHLVVSFKNTEAEAEAEEQEVKRRIPLKITLKKNMISTCQFYDPTDERKQGEKAKTIFIGRGLHIGQVNKSVEVSSTKGVTIVSNLKEPPPCKRSNRGSLLYNKKLDQLLFCNGATGWSRLGQHFNGNTSYSYKVDVLDKLTFEKRTEKHKLCIVTDIKVNEKGTCKVVKDSRLAFDNWKVVVEFNSPRGGQFCSVECFN